ncbi:MAG TPA: (5-formylfuran-3-yl)methyl phosphate synthase, partial [Gemmataceae bacterium]|nr:(5-formylfuran-3-yl)methyl phosphate synthase [Gemmataceae bacterium]
MSPRFRREPLAGVSAPQLLVSVRSAREAEAALAGGADVIDVKEPRRGPLGRADNAVLRAVLVAIAGRRPVSAALGELIEDGGGSPLPAGVRFVKWGLAG